MFNHDVGWVGTGWRRGLLALVAVGVAWPAAAQQRPLTTQDPETLGTGRVLIEAGLDYGRDVTFPATGLTGDLLRVPLLGVNIGFGPIIDVQLAGGLYNRLRVTRIRDAPLSDLVGPIDDGFTDDVEDVVIATKVRLVSEGRARPAFGIRFGTKLAYAGIESGLGLDTTDFHVSALVGKTFLSTRLVGNVGLGILADPTLSARQNNVMTLGVSVARAMTNALEVVGEVNGRVNTRSDDPSPPGTESRGTMRGGVRYTAGAGRFDVALLLGLSSNDPDVGFTFGYTYVFDAFRLP